jgi:hypothetical protein
MKMPLLGLLVGPEFRLDLKILVGILADEIGRTLASSSLSATSAPSFIAQLALPTSVQSPILVPSTSVTQPSPWPDATLEN